MPSPNRPTYDKKTVEQIKQWVADCNTWIEAREVIAKKLGIHADNVTRANKRFGPFWVAPKVDNTADGEVTSTTETDGGFDLAVETSVPKTLDEVVKLAGVDLDQWEAKGFSMTRRKTGYGWNARFARKKLPVNLALLLEAFDKAVEDRPAPKKWTYERVTSKTRDCLYVLNAHDLHLAKLCFPAETGDAPWDIKIAEQTYRSAIDELITKAPVERIEEVVVIVGSDLLQIDNEKSSTSAGTFVDSDSRLPKVFDVATKMLTDVIERLAGQFRVRVVVIPGNHDAVVSLFVGKYVEAFFRQHPNVIVDSRPLSRKYVPYGKTLIGFDHGDETKLSDLPLLLMRENQATISQYRYQEVLTGHLHQEGVDEIKGIKVRIAPALCSADRWHARKGYLGNLRQCQGLLYQRDRGLEAIFYTTPLD